MPLKFSFLPVEKKFFDLFEESARNVVLVARMFKDLLDTCEDIPGKTAKITEVEQASDRITHDIVRDLHRTFVTPFDREDMARLSSSLDDVVDFIEGAAVRLHLYRAECPVGKAATDLADVIVRSAIEVEKAVAMLKEKGDLKRILEKCVEIHKLEYEADCIYRAANAELFDNSRDLLFVIKWHEIYEYMEDSTDRCEDVADVLEGIVLKHA